MDDLYLDMYQACTFQSSWRDFVSLSAKMEVQANKSFSHRKKENAENQAEKVGHYAESLEEIWLWEYEKSN